MSDFRYFLVFVDDYSQMSWVYLLKDRTQVSNVIKNFINKIKTQFSTSMRVLRIDNALEYTQNKISHFCAFHGILHQTTWPHTSQQNGVAERKLSIS